MHDIYDTGRYDSKFEEIPSWTQWGKTQSIYQRNCSSSLVECKEKSPPKDKTCSCFTKYLFCCWKCQTCSARLICSKVGISKDRYLDILSCLKVDILNGYMN